MKLLFKAALLVAVIVAGTAAQAVTLAHAATPAGGRVDMFSPLNAGVRSPVLLTGVIGDYGTSVSIDRDGHVDENGAYDRLELTHGTITLDLAKLLAAFHSADKNLTSCTAVITADGSVPVISGTGAYRGIHGTLHATSRGGVLGRRAAGGACAKGNTPPLSVLGGAELKGTVSY